MLGPVALLLSMAVLPQAGRPTSLPPSAAAASVPETREAALKEFEEALEQYVRLHRRLERRLPPEEPVDDPAVFIQAAHDLAEAIRDARPHARAGDIFTPGPARVIREIISQTLQRYGYDAREVIRLLNDERLAGAKLPVVNGCYDRRLGAWMWPALLRALPPLPRELEYRIVDADLILIDLRADLVVDILENAMPVEDE